MRVLIAEDDPLSRALLERALHRSGYEVTSVEDGVQALCQLTQPNSPRLALLDWVMPNKTGIEVCGEVRKRQGRAYTYLIVLSSKESKQDIVQGLEAGADDYLTKPCDVEELKARLRVGERILELEDRLVEARESMRFQATHDLLTSLWNRGVILELTAREVERSRREKNCAAVIMCDIDHFKQVNDEYGHSVGDDVLREVAQRLQRSVRSYDMVGRYGGEEFLVVLNRCKPESALGRAENLRQAIERNPVTKGDRVVPVTISVGIALSRNFEGAGLERIIQEADAALYEAKRSGRNCVRMARSKKEEETSAEESTVIRAETTLTRK
ncbi:MAG TPA: diguanylate cyclase [Dongiaceae bacterium]|nr:diguanylate cyclase [Dongiaceae bacterium]